MNFFMTVALSVILINLCPPGGSRAPVKSSGPQFPNNPGCDITLHLHQKIKARTNIFLPSNNLFPSLSFSLIVPGLLEYVLDSLLASVMNKLLTRLCSTNKGLLLLWARMLQSSDSMQTGKPIWDELAWPTSPAEAGGATRDIFPGFKLAACSCW